MAKTPAPRPARMVQRFGPARRRSTTAVLLVGALVATGLAGCTSIPQFGQRPGDAGNDSQDGTGGGSAPEVPFGTQALESGHRLFGIKVTEWPSDENPVVDGFESTTGTRADVVDIYMDWQTPWRNASHAVRHTAERGSIPAVTWDPAGLTTQDIIDGSKDLTMRDGAGTSMTVDAYLNQYAVGACEAATSTDTPILLRPLRDANGDWNSWALGWSDGGDSPNSPESFRQAWTTVHDVFAKYCDPGQDILFVFSVSHADAGGNASFAQAYPGDNLVDYVGLSGYNYGDHSNWGWQSFSNLFRNAYCTIAPETSKPMLITEWSSVEAEGNKELWVATALDELASGRYPKIHGLVWVQDVGAGPGEGEWGVDSSSGSLDAYREGVSSIQAQRVDGAPQTSMEAGPPCA